MNNKLKPALIGGVVLGILSVIPFVNFLNICCCLWAIVGGLLATKLYVDSSPIPATAGDGAIVGALAGLVGAVIVLVIGIPISIAMGGVMTSFFMGMLQRMDPAQAEMMRAQFEAGQTVAGAIVNGFILAVLLFIFSIIGGLLGIPLFEKRKGSVMPPPPPNPGPGGFAA
jgi:hypothetical protein